MELTVITLNVWSGGLLFDAVTDFCSREDADIYLFQEVYNGSHPSLPRNYRTFLELQNILSTPHSHFAPTFIEVIETGEKVVQGNAIFSKYPLSQGTTIHYDIPFGIRKNHRSAFARSPRSLQRVTVQLPHHTLTVCNTQGIWGEDGVDSPRRIKMAQQILEEIGTSEPVIVGGDLNVLPNTKTIALLETKLQNVFKDVLPTTFNVARKDLGRYPGYATSVVDMLFVSPTIGITEARCPAVDISDHLPLVAVLEI